MRRRLRRVSRKVNRLAKIATESTCVYKNRAFERIVSANNFVNTHSEVLFDWFYYNATLAAVPYFDPATNSITNRDVRDATLSKNFYFKSFAEYIVKNQSNFPVTCRLYVVSPKQDTNINPVTMVNDGLLERSGGAISTVTPMYYPTESQEFTRTWRIRKKKKVYLRAGDMIKISTSTRMFKFNPADGHTTAFQKKLEARCVLVRFEGPMVHECSDPQPANPNLGVGQASLYTMIRRQTKLFYDGGAKFKQLRMIDAAQVVPNPTATLPEVPAFVQYAEC